MNKLFILNIDKTRIVLFNIGNKKKEIHIKNHIDNFVIKRVKHIKFLGVDDKLDRKCQIDHEFMIHPLMIHPLMVLV